jgi:hypothetical protein
MIASLNLCQRLFVVYQLRHILKRTIDAFGGCDSFSGGFLFVIRFRLSSTTADDIGLALNALVVLACASDDDGVAVLLGVVIKAFEEGKFGRVFRAIYRRRWHRFWGQGRRRFLTNKGRLSSHDDGAPRR